MGAKVALVDGKGSEWHSGIGPELGVGAGSRVWPHGSC